MKIENLVEKDTVLDDDYLIVDGTDGTKKAKKSTFLSEVNSRFASVITLTQNESLCLAARIGDICVLNVLKTPSISPGGTAIIGNIGTTFANSATKMLIGDQYNTWNTMVVVTGNGDVSISIASSEKKLPNAFYKGDCVLIKNE